MSTLSPHPPTAPTTGRPTYLAPRSVVPLLWVFAVVNYLYCDVVSLMDPVSLGQFLDGTVGNLEITSTFLLGAGMLMEIPMAMILVSRVAPHRIARWATVVAGTFMVVVQVGTLGFGTTPTSYYLFFSAVEVATTAFAAWYALTRWTTDA